MSPFNCAREREVSELLELGQWPHASPRDLRDHVQGCRMCGELVTVKGSLQQDRLHAMAQPILPSSSAIWWRAQLRRRNEAVARISRPILGAEIFALVIASVVAVCGIGWFLQRGILLTAWRGLDLGDWIDGLHLDALRPASLTSIESGSLGLIVALLAALAVLSGLVVYFASEKQ